MAVKVPIGWRSRLKANPFPCRAVVFLAVMLLVFPISAAGQVGGECDVPSHQGLSWTTLSSGGRILNFRYPTIRCPGGTRITADSAVVFEETSYNQLYGHVVFQDEGMRLSSDNATYDNRVRRLSATGNAILTDREEGSEFRGDNMILLRAGPDRPEDHLTITGRRPHATLYPAPRPAEAGVPEPGTPPSLDASADSLPPPDSLAARPDSANRGDTAVVSAPATLLPGPEAGPNAERVPYQIDAQRIELQGSRYFFATGAVRLTRDSLTAVADSMRYDQDQGALFLNQRARVTTASTDLSAEDIRMDILQDEVKEILARRNAVLEGEDIQVLAPTVSMVFDEGQLERLVAVRDREADSVAGSGAVEGTEIQADPGSDELPLNLRELGWTSFPVTPVAVAQDFILQGDSLEVFAPGEVLNEVWAMGRARGESMGRDSLNSADTPDLVRHDWLEGDTIVATFGSEGGSMAVPGAEAESVDPAPRPARGAEADSTADRYRLERLVARVRARSLYRMAASDSTVTEPAIHYVIGDEITITFTDGEVERMEVTGATRGIHLEPVPPPKRGGGDGSGTGGGGDPEPGDDGTRPGRTRGEGHDLRGRG